MLFKKKLANDLDTVLSVLEPFRKDMAGIAAESTYNWYWFVDGLMDNGYKVHLANPSAIQRYKGLKKSTTREAPSGWQTCCGWEYFPPATSTPKKRGPSGMSRKRLQLGATSVLSYFEHQEHHEPEPRTTDEER